MTRLNLAESSLLDISGELGENARRRLHRHLAVKPGAAVKYRDLQQAYGRLKSLPGPMLTPVEEAEIPARIKAGIHAVLDDRVREQQARRRAKMMHYALAGLSAVAAAIVVVCGALVMNQASVRRHEADNIAHLNNVIDRLASYDERPSAYDQELTDVETSIRQLQVDSTSLAGVQTNDFTPLLDALASVPDSGVDAPESATPATPGPVSPGSI